MVVKPGAVGFISLKDGDGESMEATAKNSGTPARFFVYWHKGEFLEALRRNGYELIDYMYHPINEVTNWHSFFVKVPPATR